MRGSRRRSAHPGTEVPYRAGPSDAVATGRAGGRAAARERPAVSENGGSGGAAVARIGHPARDNVIVMHGGSQAGLVADARLFSKGSRGYLFL